MSEYFMPPRNAGFLNKVYTALKTGRRFRPSFPSAVQFQTLSTCNAKCIFCPHHHTPELLPPGRMEDGLIDKIVDECGRHFVGRVSPFLTNEPLLDRRMPAILASIKKKCPFFTKTKINTNAALLTPETGRRLIESGLTHLWISVNGYSEASYRASMGLDFQKTMRNIDAFLDLKKELRVTRPRVIVTTLRTTLVEHELEDARAHWATRDVTFRIHKMDNRAGEMVESLRSARPALRRSCDLFLKQAYIVENGDMILCCHDWRQSVKVGNVAEKSIKEVWNSPQFLDRIYEYYEERFDNIEICRNCC